jgi:predicted SAM-dependent methyltransferase
VARARAERAADGDADLAAPVRLAIVTSAAAARMLNVGCGQRFRSGWVNVDISPQHPDVMRCDATAGLPFPDDHFDVVYHSHVLEHVRRAEAPSLLRECRRVLRPGGTLRIATPDLERLCELYLEKLRSSRADEVAADHEWLVLELFDQTVREQSGGALLEYLRRPLPNEEFVIERIGEEGRELLARIRSAAAAETIPTKPRLHQRLANGIRGGLMRVRERVVTSWYGADAVRALRIGQFRLSGEVHHWLYDRASLARLLVCAGFVDPQVRTAVDSAIPGWNGFFLDMTPAGNVIKPDSLFMEARKPAGDRLR